MNCKIITLPFDREAEGFPVYLIATNRQLTEIVIKRPNTLEGLKMIEGMGEKKVKKYGREILNIIKSEEKESGASHNNTMGKNNRLDT